MRRILLGTIFIFSIISISFAQSELEFSNCSDILFEVNNETADIVGECSTDITFEQVASYVSSEDCSQSGISWVIYVDLWNDGAYDLEFNSNLPSSDTTNDDTNGNSIPDYYISPTVSGAVQQVKLFDIVGGHSEHSIYWEIKDACGIESNCTQEFILVDTQPPVPYCVNLSTYVLSPEKIEYADVHASDFMIYPFDNCTPQDELRFSFSGDSIVPMRPVTCDDVINSPVAIDVYVWDNNDNVDFCTVFLNVIATETVDCYEFPMQSVSGYVKTEDNEPIEDAEVIIYCNMPEFPRSEYTDANGFYSFSNIPTSAGCYLTTKKDDDYVDDNAGHILLKNQPLAICDKTAGALAALNRDDIFISESTYHYDGGGCC